jgi:putative NADH-flavin reductase
MHFFVAGATGRTGRAFVIHAAAAGHQITAYVRDRAKASELPAGVAIAVGDVLDAATTSAAIASEHVIVSALGGGGLAGTVNLIAAAVVHGAQRFLGVVGGGVLQADEHRLRSELPDYPPRFAAISKEHVAVYRALRESPLEWTLACTPDIVEGPPSGSCTELADYMPPGTRRVTTGDIAAFWLREAEAPSFSRRRVGLNMSRTI